MNSKSFKKSLLKRKKESQKEFKKYFETFIDKILIPKLTNKDNDKSRPIFKRNNTRNT